MDNSKRNAYTVLELQPDPDVDDAAIKKAYRRLAILKHPDKNRDNPNAAAEFAELEQAYRLLLDKDARGALDDLLRAQAQRAARESQVGDKRRKLREELERRERQSVSERSEEEMARQRLKVELERLRRKMEDEDRRQRQQAAELSAAIAAQRAAAAGTAATADPGGSVGASTSYGTEDGAASAAVKAQLRRTLKVTWDPTCREYGSEELRSIFSGFGAPVQDVVLRDRKKKRKATALVIMGTEAAAAAAASSVCGDPTEPLLVVPLVGDLETADEPQQQDGAAPSPGHGAAAAAATTAAPGGGSGPGQLDGDDGLLPRDGEGRGGAGPGPQSVLQRPARLPETRPAARPLFPLVGGPGSGPRTAFPVASSGPGLFPSAASASGTASGTVSAGPGIKPVGQGTGDGGSGTGGRGGAGGGAAALAGGATKPAPLGAPLAACAALPGPVLVTVAVRAAACDNDEDAVNAASMPRTAARRDLFVASSVRGTFYPDLYLCCQDCIVYKGKRISRSAFGKLANSSTAKWHRSIRVVRGNGELEALGEWLTRHGLPVLKLRGVSRNCTTGDPPLVLPTGAAAATEAAAAGFGGCAANAAEDDSSAEEESSGTPPTVASGSAAAVGQGEPAFGSWRAATGGGGSGTAGRGVGGGGGGSSFEDEVLEKMRRAAAARHAAAGPAAGKETAG